VPKRRETIGLEEALLKDTKEKRLYGCEEVTIGFYGKGHGNEIVDFITMDSKGIVKCYELKISMQDLKSGAKMSWYGHYNYLVVTEELFNMVPNWSTFIPAHVGIIVGCELKRKKLLNPSEDIADFADSESNPRCQTVIEWHLTGKRRAKKCDIEIDVNMMLKESMVRSIFWNYDYETYKAANDGLDSPLDFKSLVFEEKQKYLADRNLKRRKREEMKL